jgi:hypothetical protein
LEFSISEFSTKIGTGACGMSGDNGIDLGQEDTSTDAGTKSEVEGIGTEVCGTRYKLSCSILFFPWEGNSIFWKYGSSSKNQHPLLYMFGLKWGCGIYTLLEKKDLETLI